MTPIVRMAGTAALLAACAVLGATDAVAQTIDVVAGTLDTVRAAAVVPAAAGVRGTTVSLDYSHVRFDTAFEPWNLASAGLTHRFRRATVVGRVNYAERFGGSSAQGEVDVYPTFGRRGYAYLNFGVAGQGSFPRTRFGAELYGNLPRGWEVSGGYRELRFTATDVRIVTGSVGKYHGNYWLSLRPFLTSADGSGGGSTAGTATARRYFAAPGTYLGGTLGLGTNPTDDTTELEIGPGDTFRAGLEGVHRLTPRIRWSWQTAFERESLNGDERNRVELGLGIRHDF